MCHAQALLGLMLERRDHQRWGNFCWRYPFNVKATATHCSADGYPIAMKDLVLHNKGLECIQKLELTTQLLGESVL